MPQRHHRHERHDRPSGEGGPDGTDVDDEIGRLTIVDADSGMLAHAERETQRRSLEMQQHLAGLIRRGSRVFVGF